MTSAVIVFDNDGTLADSLPPHIEFLHRMNAKHQLDLHLPPVDDLAGCRALAAAPMDAFILKAGFPASLVPEIVSEYESDFSNEHPVSPFMGVRELLKGLAESEVRMAVVSSNTSTNVKAALGPELCSYFTTILGIDNSEPSKKDSIRNALNVIGVDPETTPCIYVGDTIKDAECATHAKCRFVGVNYGFEDLSWPGLPYSVASSVQELEGILRSAANIWD